MRSVWDQADQYLYESWQKLAIKRSIKSWQAGSYDLQWDHMIESKGYVINIMEEVVMQENNNTNWLLHHTYLHQPSLWSTVFGPSVMWAWPAQGRIQLCRTLGNERDLGWESRFTKALVFHCNPCTPKVENHILGELCEQSACVNTPLCFFFQKKNELFQLHISKSF